MSDFARRTLRSLQAGLRWLKQSAETASDPRDLAITTESLIAVERNRHSQTIQRLTATLARTQSNDGSWNNEVWDTAWWGSTKTLDMHVSWLRKKLGDDAANPRFITTVRGVGFRFERE